MYCYGDCKHLDDRKHICKATGTKLAHMKQSGTVSFVAHEHRGLCQEDLRRSSHEEVRDDA